MADLPYEVSVSEVKKRLDAGERVYLLDVREPAEEKITGPVMGSRLIPMGQVPSRLGEIESVAEDSLIVVFCHHGMRSLNTVSWLRKQGVTCCVSMAGGIEAWSTLIDPSIPRY